MHHLGTASGRTCPSRLPGEIARGKGDAYLIRLTRTIAGYGQPAYIRLMGEMNNCDNAYSSHSCTRRPAGRQPLARDLKKAWKRVYLIIHGGEVADVDAALARRGLPAVQTGAARIPEARSPWSGRRWSGARRHGSLAPGKFWPGSPLGRLGGHELLLALPEWTGSDLLQDLVRGQAQAVRDRRWAMWGADTPSFANRLFD